MKKISHRDVKIKSEFRGHYGGSIVMTNTALHGDGIHDDREAIQEMLNGDQRIVYLPMPKVNYLIGGTLRIPSGRTLVLPEQAVIRQANGVNAPMLRNLDGETGAHDIAVIGGIWDMNNMGQAGNAAVKRQEAKDDSVYAIQPDVPDTCDETGFSRNVFPDSFYRGSMNGLVFENVRGLDLLNVTFRDPVSYCVSLCRTSDFHIENISFDFNDGNPLPANMDGIHMEGGCHDGIVRSLRGTVYDDMVALNADELVRGDIYNITIDSLYAKHAHSAVRMLSSGSVVHDITISNVRGTWVTYCVAFSKYYKMGNGVPGRFENITIRDCEITKSDILPWFREINYPLFWFQTETVTDGLHIENLHRTPCGKMVDLFGPENGAAVRNLTMNNVRGDMALDKENIDAFAEFANR